MTKIKGMTVLVAAICMILGLHVSSHDVFAYQYDMPVIDDIEIELNEETYSSIAYPDGNVSQASVDRANELLNTLPEGLLERFINDGWTFYITDKNIAATYFAGQYNSVMGVTFDDDKTIYIEQRSKAIEESTVHEFGHYVDDTYGCFTDTNEFAQIYNTESGSFVNAFNVNFHYDVHEFWADGFYRYYDSERETLRNACPQLCSYIEGIVESLC